MHELCTFGTSICFNRICGIVSSVTVLLYFILWLCIIKFMQFVLVDLYEEMFSIKFSPCHLIVMKVFMLLLDTLVFTLLQMILQVVMF